MSETEQPEVHKPAKFDLSDGISSEDFIALGSGLWKIIVFVLKIVFFPLIWVYRMLGRLKNFLFSPHAERLLTEDEKILVSEVPMFLGFLGLVAGAVFAVFAYFNNRDKLLASFQNITDFFKFLGGLVKGTFDVLGIIWGFIYEGILISTKNFIVNDIFKNTDIVIPFLALAVIGFFGAIILLVLLELNFVRTFLRKVSNGVNYIVSLPFKLYDRLQEIWTKVLAKMGYPVVGGEDMLSKYTNKFYQKALKLILLFAFLTIFAGLYIFFSNKDLSKFDSAESFIFLILVMLSAGLFAGYPVAYLLIKFLKSLSKDKYEARTVIPAKTVTTGGSSTTSSSSSTPTAKAVPVTQLKGKTAKERAEERRRLREMQRKNK